MGSCVALNLKYSGCCVWSLSRCCSINGCNCDQDCHNWNDCCNDIADIGCYPTTFSSPIVFPTPTDILSKTNSEVHATTKCWKLFMKIRVS